VAHFIYNHAEWRDVKCRYAKCRYADCRSARLEPTLGGAVFGVTPLKPLLTHKQKTRVEVSDHDEQPTLLPTQVIYSKNVLWHEVDLALTDNIKTGLNGKGIYSTIW